MEKPGKTPRDAETCKAGACFILVFLLGDRRAWAPGGGRLCELWGIVRLAALFFMWDMRCSARQRGRPASARAVVAAIVTHLRGRIRDDSLRALPDSPDAAAPFGARPRVTLDGFVARWCHRGVLCSVSPSGAQLCICASRYRCHPHRCHDCYFVA